MPDDYRLGQSVQFLTGFTPQQVDEGVHDATLVRLVFATPLAPSWEPTWIAITEIDGRLHVEWTGDAADDVVARRGRRILGLDVDIAGLADIISADPVLEHVVDWSRGVRPSLFWSPYEAAIWAVISQRIQMRQATNLKSRLAATVGGSVDGVSAPTDTMSCVQEIDGVGPFSAELILVQDAGAPDVFPTNERRLHDIMRDLYGRPDASPAELAEIAVPWAPFRSWLSFQLRAHAPQP